MGSDTLCNGTVELSNFMITHKYNTTRKDSEKYAILYSTMSCEKNASTRLQQKRHSPQKKLGAVLPPDSGPDRPGERDSTQKLTRGHILLVGQQGWGDLEPGRWRKTLGQALKSARHQAIAAAARLEMPDISQSQAKTSMCRAAVHANRDYLPHSSASATVWGGD